MTDDEVLNLRGWGKPAKIVRSKASREWREDWTYAARATGSRQLRFVNGKLAAVDTEPPEASTIGTLASAPPESTVR